LKDYGLLKEYILGGCPECKGKLVSSPVMHNDCQHNELYKCESCGLWFCAWCNGLVSETTPRFYILTYEGKPNTKDGKVLLFEKKILAEHYIKQNQLVGYIIEKCSEFKTGWSWELDEKGDSKSVIPTSEGRIQRVA
jgi:hypothetical protein